MSENGEIYTAGKNFTLPPALTALTNSTYAHKLLHSPGKEAAAHMNANLQISEHGISLDRAAIFSN